MTVNALDPNLSSLAANAAVELDLLINGDSTDLEGVRQLGDRLRQSVDWSASSQQAYRLQVDTETETVLGQAFVRANLGDPGTILSELFRRTEQIATQLSSTDSGTEHKGLESQRAFCLALSQVAAAHRQLTLDTRPSPAMSWEDLPGDGTA